MTNFPTVANVGKDLQAALGQSKVNEVAGGAVQHIKYDTYKGEWLVGKEKTNITDEEIVVNTQSIVHGWHLWVDGDNSSRMASFTADIPEQFEPVKDKKGKLQQAAEARGLQAMWEDGDKDVLVQWEASTFGCRSCIDSVMQSIRARAATEADFLYPIVKLGVAEPYENSYKEGEMIYNPTMEITGWCNIQGEEATDVEKLEAPVEEAEVIEAEAEVVEDTPAPKRRRRKSA